jgi:alkanesulfonate monooxygenase SsuD/methylene tetrahydromethanopterin reductase-like flavin-dependent oxidoreductase (luciferase family)
MVSKSKLLFCKGGGRGYSLRIETFRLSRSLETVMEFGLFSNGFRPHTSAAQSYQDDIDEIVLADQLGFRDVYISEHHGEPPYINRVDTIPAPELMMCKLAALTKNIRMGSAVKLFHLHHPLDVAVQAAIIENLVGKGRFIFGFGSGFPHPQFAEAPWAYP